MAATVVLDTNILSYLARSDPGVAGSFASWLDAGNGVVLSRVTVYEFRRGVYAGAMTPQETQAGELFLVNFGVIEVDEHTWCCVARPEAVLVADRLAVPWEPDSGSEAGRRAPGWRLGRRLRCRQSAHA